MTFIWVIVPYFVGVGVLALLARIILKEADENQQAKPLPGGGLEFAPEKNVLTAMLIFIGIFGVLGVVGTVSALISGHGLVFSLAFVLFALLMACILPGSITLTEVEIEQRFWLGKRKSIHWDDLRSVTVDRKQGRVTIASRTGVKIQHARQLPDRARLLAELEARCPDKMPRPDGSAPLPHHPVVPPPPPVVAPPADPQV